MIGYLAIQCTSKIIVVSQHCTSPKPEMAIHFVTIGGLRIRRKRLPHDAVAARFVVMVLILGPSERKPTATHPFEADSCVWWPVFIMAFVRLLGKRECGTHVTSESLETSVIKYPHQTIFLAETYPFEIRSL